MQYFEFLGSHFRFAKLLWSHLIGHPQLVGEGVYFTTFVDISYRFAVKATFTNRKCNISDFGGLDPTLQDCVTATEIPDSTLLLEFHKSMFFVRFTGANITKF